MAARTNPPNEKVGNKENKVVKKEDKKLHTPLPKAMEDTTQPIMYINQKTGILQVHYKIASKARKFEKKKKFGLKIQMRYCKDYFTKVKNNCEKFRNYRKKYYFWRENSNETFCRFF